MSPIHAYLTFDGNAAEAMRFYEKTLGGKMHMMMTMGEAPGAEQFPPGAANRIMHAALTYGDGMLMASDTMPGQAYEGMKGFGVALTIETVADAQRVFNAFADGGNVTMPFGKTFWVEAFGMVTDRFGTPWLINGGKPLV
ncbi:VOC family protein [Variovorax sp. PAMC26660]|uniref:VOC family protein n=1 Tax=Variovorax sp. PAMC26660 TaxID=2762322 RepID=UPI00164DBFD7|nr:VOC family protein [Variovorax sp. PAMC26660]QNK69382.1 VOC family protein [Variovorax sp. PAMC26660]